MLFESISRQAQARSRVWYDEIRSYTQLLVSFPTVSPSVDGENKCARIIETLLTDSTTLHTMLWPTGDGRNSVACLLCGTHPSNTGRTTILMGHYDTVGVTEFDGLAAATGDETTAFDVSALRRALEVGLRTRRSPNDEDAWCDLRASWQFDGHEEPAWMFGRGSLDMKSGIAVSIAVMRQLWHERENLAGNILFLACPDEENESLGIRSAMPYLLELRQSLNLDYLGIINTDYVAPRSSRLAHLESLSTPRTIYAGTVGKLLPSFYILGVPTHVGEPFRGVDANQIAAALIERINLNPGLSDRWESKNGRSERVVPPVSLRMRDLKTAYSAQTVTEALVCINWLTCTQTPDEVMVLILDEAMNALEQVLERRQQHWQELSDDFPRPPQYAPLVLTFEQLCDRVRAARGWNHASLNGKDDPLVALMDDIISEVDALVSPQDLLAHQLAYQADLPEKSRLIVARLVREANLKGPAIITFFAPPFYPHVKPQNGELLDAVACQVEAVADTEVIEIRDFYPYISDLSYVRLDRDVQSGLNKLIANMPLFGRGYSLDFDAMRALDCHVINIGPWGKDAHSLYERVYVPYSFEVLPQLIYEVIKDVL